MGVVRSARDGLVSPAGFRVQPRLAAAGSGGRRRHTVSSPARAPYPNVRVDRDVFPICPGPVGRAAYTPAGSPQLPSGGGSSRNSHRTGRSAHPGLISAGGNGERRFGRVRNGSPRSARCYHSPHCVAARGGRQWEVPVGRRHPTPRRQRLPTPGGLVEVPLTSRTPAGSSRLVDGGSSCGSSSLRSAAMLRPQNPC